MARFAPTGKIEDSGVEPSVAQIPWASLHGVFGPSDGSAGARANVPSALSVLRHAPLYAAIPSEIDDAFTVLERHALRDGQLAPVAVTIVPFLFEFIGEGSPLASRISDLLADYVAAAHTLAADARARLHATVAEHVSEVIGWLGRHDRAAAALAVHVPAVRPAYLAALEGCEELSPFALLALLELDTAPSETLGLALELIDDASAQPLTRAAAGAFLARFGDLSPAVREWIDAALPPSAPAALTNLVAGLWVPRIERPVVAPKMLDAEVVFAGERLVLVSAGNRNVTLPWDGSQLQRGDVIRVAITAHGQPKLALINQPDGGVRVIDF